MRISINGNYIGHFVQLAGARKVLVESDFHWEEPALADVAAALLSVIEEFEQRGLSSDEILQYVSEVIAAKHH